MKKLVKIIFVVALLFSLGACEEPNNNNGGNGNEEKTVDVKLAEQFNDFVAEKHVYVTSIGQSGQIAIFDTLLEDILGKDAFAEKVTVNAVLKASEVPAGSVVVLIPGASDKGLAGAGTDLAAEKQRAEAFSNKAAAEEIVIIVVHMGGEDRRGDSTDQLITTSLKNASLVLVEVEGDFDNFFSNLNKDYIYFYSSAFAFEPPLKQIFNLE